jgi:oxygen-dependent protoporphyrinogen oxidase
MTYPGSRPRLVIIGGGITGLTVAHEIRAWSEDNACPVDLTLLEAGDRVGGVIRTEQRDGCLLESGPDSFVTDKPWALQLCEGLGLRDELIGTNPAQRRDAAGHPRPDPSPNRPDSWPAHPPRSGG